MERINGIFTNRKEFSAMVTKVGIAALMSACSYHSTVTSNGVELASTAQPDLQSTFDNVVAPIAQVTQAPAYWHNEDAAIVCEVGAYCVRIERTKK